MSTFQVIKEAIDAQMNAFTEFKKVNDERIEAIKKGNDAKAAELDVTLAKINSEIAKQSQIKQTAEAEINLMRERLEELEVRASNPKKTVQDKVKDDYKDAFCNWIRNKGQSPNDEQKLHELMKKDVTIGTGAGGGFAVPEQIARDIELMEKKFSPVRNLVKVVQVGTSDYKELVNIRGATSGWVGESGARTATATPQLREVTPTHGELYAYPQASEWSLDDVFFNVDAWLAENVAQEFALLEGDAVIRGDGVSKPTGMTNSAPTNVADQFPPSRAAAVYQFIANVDAGLLIKADALIDTVYTLNSEYRSGASWAMNSVTTGAVRKLKDSTNQYLWQPGLQAGQPDMLLGYPVATWEQMDSPVNNGHPIAFGNFRRGYVLVDRVGLRVTRDNVTNVGFVRFYVRRREGGIVLNNDAIKFIKTTTA